MTTVASGTERGVSTVIGVVLVVDITVLIAAVIGVMILDFGDSLETEVQAGVSIDTETDALVVSIVTLGDAESITLTGDPYDHLDSEELPQDDLREIHTPGELRIEPDDLEDEGRKGRLTAVAVDGEADTAVTSDAYDLER